jgi:hypothetical protein
MTESNHPELAGRCAHCGELFARRHYVNQHGQAAFSTLVPAKYCSPDCRYKAARKRAREAREASTHPDDTQVQSGSVTAPAPASPAPHDTAKSNDAFERLRGDAVLSDWKPYVTLETDIPDIPEFLRRA